MLTGKKSNLSVDGETAAYYFSESGSDKGCGYNGSKDDYLYYQGRLVKADSGSDYQVFCVDNKMYLVNESGKIQTSSKNYKVNGSWTFKVPAVLFISLMMIRNPQERLLLLMRSPFRK